MTTAAETHTVHARFAETLERTQWMARERLQAYQDGLLEHLLIFAHDNSAFYRARLSPIFQAGQPALKRFTEIPVLTRDDLAQHGDAINPAAIPDALGAVRMRQTSGSTGAAMRFRTCDLALVSAECMMHRHYRWHGIDVTAPMVSVRYYGSSARQCPDGVTEQRWTSFGPGAPHHTLDIHEPTGGIVDWLARRAPRQMITFPSLALDLGLRADRARWCDAPLHKIVGISETITREQRQAIRERLGCEIAQIYACSEMGCIALQSPADDRYLVCEESVLVEILDDDGQPVRAGDSGRIVLTSFYNYATPFIRYDIGDRGCFASAPDRDGRTLKVIERIDGRARAHLLDAGGRRVSAHAISASPLSDQLGVGRFQIRQQKDGTIDIDHVGVPGASLAAIRSSVDDLLGGTRTLRLHPVEALPRTSGGKRDLVVSDATDAMFS